MQPPNDLEFLINIKKRIRKHPPATDFPAYRILDQLVK